MSIYLFFIVIVAILLVAWLLRPVLAHLLLGAVGVLSYAIDLLPGDVWLPEDDPFFGALMCAGSAEID